MSSYDELYMIWKKTCLSFNFNFTDHQPCPCETVDKHRLLCLTLLICKWNDHLFLLTWACKERIAHQVVYDNSSIKSFFFGIAKGKHGIEQRVSVCPHVRIQCWFWHWLALISTLPSRENISVRLQPCDNVSVNKCSHFPLFSNLR